MDLLLSVINQHFNTAQIGGGHINMKKYEQQINLYFELKGTPESSRESYLRRMKAFIIYIENQKKS